MLRSLQFVSVVLFLSPSNFAQARPINGQGAKPVSEDHVWQRGPLEISIQFDNQSPLVSDLLAVLVRVRAPSGVDLELPKLDNLPKDLQTSGMRRIGPTTEPAGSRVWELGFKLEVVVAGIYELPAFEVRYRNSGEAEWASAVTEPVPIEFRSLLGDDPERAEPKPNPGPAGWPREPLPWLLMVAALVTILLAGAAAFLAWSRWSRSPRPIPMVSAYRKAMDAIHRIDMAGWLEQGEVDRFYTELSGVIRHYVEDRFSLRAPEQTTEEFLMELTERPILTGDQRLALGHFLERCDLVKFAKVRPTASEGQAALRAAETFVQATRDDSVMVLA